MKLYPSEHKIQSSLIEWCELAKGKLPELQLLFAVPNESYGGTKKDVIRGAKFKQEGRKRGVPDLVLPVARGGYHGLFLEMKKKGGVVNDYQKFWLEALQEQGYYTNVAYDLDKAIWILESYLNGKFEI